MNTSDSIVEFQALLAEFARGLDLPYDHDAQALEISADTLRAHVVLHPGHEANLAIVIEVLSLGTDEDMAALTPAQLLLLHRLNHSAWTEHDWQIVIDDDNDLSLRCHRGIAATGAQALEELLVDGLERAQALAELWREGPSASAGPLEWDRLGQGVIRG